MESERTLTDEFPWRVLDAAGQTCGERRTEADARSLARRLQATTPAAGPYEIWEIYAGPSTTGAALHADGWQCSFDESGVKSWIRLAVPGARA